MASRYGTLSLTNSRGQHVISLHNGHEYIVEDVSPSPASELFCKGVDCERTCSVSEYFRNLGWAVPPRARVALVRPSNEDYLDESEEDTEYSDEDDSNDCIERAVVRRDNDKEQPKLVLPIEMAALLGDDCSDAGSMMDMFDSLEDWQNLPRLVGDGVSRQKAKADAGLTFSSTLMTSANIYEIQDGKPQRRYRTKKPLQPVRVGHLLPGQQVTVDTASSLRRFPGMVRITSPLSGLIAISCIQLMKLKPGDSVHVYSPVRTANTKSRHLKVGSTGVVLMLDTDGDARIDFCKEGLQWIRWWHFQQTLELTSYTPKAAESKAAALVAYAKAGNLEAVRNELAKHSGDTKMITAVVNTAKTWTESEEKYGGYTKSWTWYGDTALIAAARLGHDTIVQELLHTGVCDPSLESCPSCDAYETALQAATRTGRGCYYRDKSETPGLERCKQLLLVAEECWPKAPYSSAHAGRRHKFTNSINCTLGMFRAKLDAVPPLSGCPPESARTVPETSRPEDRLIDRPKPHAKLDRLLLQAAQYSGPDSTFEPVSEIVSIEGVGPDAVRAFLLRGANPTVKDSIRGSRVDHSGQYSSRGPTMFLNAVEVAAEAKATLRRYIDGIFDGSSTSWEWAYDSKEDMRDEAEQLLTEEALLGESVALLEAAGRVWERHARSEPCQLLTTHRIGSPGCHCPLTVDVEIDCRFGPHEMDELRTEVSKVQSAKPVDNAKVQTLASAMLPVAKACRAKHIEWEQKQREARLIEDQLRKQRQAEQREFRRQAREEEIKLHQQTYGDPKVCRVCSKRLRTIEGCVQHMRAVHAGG
eukprot:TRINITY_DN9767_c0_g2_i1.p1 TRINITY_DN9767_c0_g2~~TRINITY_DN9767_c0_g2_i1.p1  ORF type:complete len:875 (+),score=95.82 TRINITY_DN9767_c0_g2_i1:185-2626(+)